MTYGYRPGVCSGYFSGWQSFWLDYGEVAGRLQSLESPLHCLRVWMGVPLRNHDAAVTGNSHDVESIHSRFSEPCKHCMAWGVQDEICRKDCLAHSFDLGSADFPVPGD